jgi:non-heme chloroperoxidase
LKASIVILSRITTKLLTSIVAAILLAAAALAGIVAFGTSSLPQPLPDAETPFKKIDFHDQPALQSFRARDGAALAYRVYQGQGNKAVVMLHGAAGSSFMLHVLAKAIQASGFTVYVPDIRGHGASGGSGDIAYNGQLQDDVADFARFVHNAQPSASLSLLGHSAGGGLALRFAGGPDGALFEQYVLLSPMLARDAPTVRPDVDGFAKPFKARYAGLTILDRFGFHRFEALPVLAFAMPAAPGNMMTPLYSYRLSQNFTQNTHYLDDLRHITKHTELLVGADDEFFYADKFAPLVHGVRSDISVSVVPKVGHVGIILNPAAARQVIAALDRGYS